MNILNETKTNVFSKPELEQVEKEKQEYKLLGKYIRKRGLLLFSYNPTKDELIQLTVKKKKDAVLVYDAEGKLNSANLTHEECEVDARNIHFEALNIASATKRLQKYKSGKIKELCNLRVPSENSMKLF